MAYEDHELRALVFSRAYLNICLSFNNYIASMAYIICEWNIFWICLVQPGDEVIIRK
jgi:hypothetical protein